MRKWRVSYRAIHNLYVPEYKDFLFWHEMDILEDVDNYLRVSGIKKTTICRDDMAYFWGFKNIDDAIVAIREYERVRKYKEVRRNKVYYLTDNFKVKNP